MADPRPIATRLNLARALLVIGLDVGLPSWRESVGHIGNADFSSPLIPPGSANPFSRR